MKTIINFFKKQRELRLRKWVAKHVSDHHIDDIHTLQKIYDWITAVPPQSRK